MSAMMSREVVRVSATPQTVDEVVHSSMTREQILNSIITMNQTATIEFLSSFTDRALRLYMEHLQAAAMPRGRNARWVRPGDSRAVCMHECED